MPALPAWPTRSQPDVGAGGEAVSSAGRILVYHLRLPRGFRPTRFAARFVQSIQIVADIPSRISQSPQDTAQHRAGPPTATVAMHHDTLSRFELAKRHGDGIPNASCLPLGCLGWVTKHEVFEFDGV